MLSVKFELDTSSRIRCPGQVGRAAAVEAGGLALVEAARAHDVGGALAAAGVARVREAGGQRQHVAQGRDVAADGRHGADRVEPVGGLPQGFASRPGPGGLFFPRGSCDLPCLG